MDSFKFFIMAMEAISSRIVTQSWEVPADLDPLQTFPVHIMHFVGNMYEDGALYEKCRHIPMLQWSEKWRGQFYIMGIKSLFALECSE